MPNKQHIQVIIDAIDNASKVMKKTSGNMESYGKKMTAAGKSMSMSLTAPMALLAGLSVSAASNYSRAMAKTRAVTNATQEEFKDLNEVAKELGRTTEFTATQVGNAMGFMGMAGMETDAILGSINKTLDLATIGQLDMARAADITTNIMSGFGMEADEINRVVDVLAKTITSSNTNVEMLGESMKYVAPVAKGFGMSIEETAAVMGVLGSAGIQSSMAGTTLRNVILELDKEAKNLGISIFDTSGKLLPFADILGILEDQGLSTSEIIETVGKRGGPGLVALLEKGSQGMREYVDDLENVKGYSNEVASDMRKGLHAELDNLKSAFEGLQIAIVDTLMPVLKPMIEKLTEMMRKFSDLDPDMKRIIVTVGVLAAAIGPLLMALGFLVSSFKYVAVGLKVLKAVMLVFLHPLKSITIGIKALGTAIRFFTAHPLILALTALVAVGMYWYKNWDKIVSGAQYLWEGLQVAVISVVNKIIGALNRLPGVDIPLQKINVVTRQASKAVAGLDAEFGSLSQTSEGLKKDLAGLEGELVKNSTSIHDLGKVAEAVGEQSEDAFKEVAESLSSIRKEIEELYDDITKSGDKYRKENENEEESFYESVAGMVAEAEKKIVGLEEDKESTLADLRKERLQAIKDEDEKEIERLDQKIAEEITKTGSKITAQQAIIKTYQHWNLNIEDEVAEKRMVLAMNEMERLRYNYDRKKQLREIEFLQEEIERAKKLVATTQEHNQIISLIDSEKMAFINAEIEKGRTFRERLADSKEDLRVWINGAKAQYDSWATYARNIPAPNVKQLFSEVSTGFKGFTQAAQNYSMLPGYAQGTDYVPKTGAYLLHQGEAVTPAGRSGGITVNINGGTYLSTEVAEDIGDKIIEKLKLNLRF